VGYSSSTGQDAVLVTGAKMGRWGTLGGGILGFRDNNQEVGVGFGTADLLDNCPWYPWTGVESPFLWQGTLGKCSGVIDHGLRFFALILLGTKGSYAASEFSSSASLSTVIGDPFRVGRERGGGEGDLSSGILLLTLHLILTLVVCNQIGL
jgi:hypothetical protein